MRSAILDDGPKAELSDKQDCASPQRNRERPATSASESARSFAFHSASSGQLRVDYPDLREGSAMGKFGFVASSIHLKPSGVARMGIENQSVAFLPRVAARRPPPSSFFLERVRGLRRLRVTLLCSKSPQLISTEHQG